MFSEINEVELNAACRAGRWYIVEGALFPGIRPLAAKVVGWSLENQGATVAFTLERSGGCKTTVSTTVDRLKMTRWSHDGVELCTFQQYYTEMREVGFQHVPETEPEHLVTLVRRDNERSAENFAALPPQERMKALHACQLRMLGVTQ